MTTDNMLDALPFDVPDRATLVVLGSAVLVILIVLAVLLRKLRHVKVARIVTTLATGLGLGWSAQGMWDTAVNHYHMTEQVAWVIFVVFEALLLAKMLKANEYRSDIERRAKPVRFVWITASIMAVVVAAGEGWAQAPARLAIPLLVAYGWWTDLTADDPPGARLETSFRWTPRRIGIRIGMLRAGADDAETVDRDLLRDRITQLAFRIEHGDAKLNDLLRREVRLARLKTLADDADIQVVRARLARSKQSLAGLPSEPAPRKQIARPAADPDRMPQGVHMRDGQLLRGPELRADAILLMRRSIATGAPLTTAQLAGHYTPPLKSRSADTLAREGRKPVNGYELS